MSRLHLFVPFFRSASEPRHAELLECLRLNTKCAHIDRIYVVVEDPKHEEELFSHIKIRVVRPSEKTRQTFSSVFALANAENPEINNVSIIANADIYFDHTVAVLKQIEFNKNCFALSRWDIVKSGEKKMLREDYAQDAWIFGQNGIACDKIEADFYFGKPGCDNRIAHELQKAGYFVHNPAKTIVANHLHLSNVRTYQVKFGTERSRETVQGPYLHVAPCGFEVNNDGKIVYFS